MRCYCGTTLTFEKCCAVFIHGEAAAPSAETLMRSRYSAYVIADIDYLLHTTHISVRKNFSAHELERWARSCEWQKLDVLSATGVAGDPQKGEVIFKAHYLDGEGKKRTHYEHSFFLEEGGKWYYLQGKEPDLRFQPSLSAVNRNSSCPCGSGKKFKKCCG